jgi:hypothetical protein
MKKIVLFAGLLVGALNMYTPTSFAQQSQQIAKAAACPAGQITCIEWCRRYNASQPLCLTGHSNSCDKIGGNNACVAIRYK